MTRETKAGIVVSCSFLCLVGVVLVSKWKQKDPEPVPYAQADGTIPVPPEPTAVGLPELGSATPPDAGAAKDLRLPLEAVSSTEAMGLKNPPVDSKLRQTAATSLEPTPPGPALAASSEPMLPSPPPPAPVPASGPSMAGNVETKAVPPAGPSGAGALVPKPPELSGSATAGPGTFEAKPPTSPAAGSGEPKPSFLGSTKPEDAGSKVNGPAPGFTPTGDSGFTPSPAGPTGGESKIIMPPPSKLLVGAESGSLAKPMEAPLPSATTGPGFAPSRAATPPATGPAPFPAGPGFVRENPGTSPPQPPSGAATPLPPPGPTGVAANTDPTPVPVPFPSVAQGTSTPMPSGPASPPADAGTGAGSGVRLMGPVAPSGSTTPAPSGVTMGELPSHPVATAPATDEFHGAKTGRLDPADRTLPSSSLVAQGPAAPLPPVESGQHIPPLGTPAMTGSPPIVVPPSPGAVPQVDSFDEEIYPCKGGESFQDISKQFYLSDKYAQALLLFNRQHPQAPDGIRLEPPSLEAGQRVFIPPLRILVKQFGKAIPNYVAPTVSGMVPPAVAAAPVQPPMPAPVQSGALPPGSWNTPFTGLLYKVHPGGEMFLEIARHTLGNEERWREIATLNPLYRPETRVPADSILKVPADARIEVGEKP